MSPGANTSGKQAECSSATWRPNRPNILITGTPGVGKTTLSKALSGQLGLRHIEVGAFARERDLLAHHDTEHDAYYMHEDAVLDELEPLMTEGGIVLDHHSCDWYPERWISLVVVLRTGTEQLYDRLQSREYGHKKLQENVQAEIMQVVYEEAVESYPRVKVMELQNDSEEQRETNIVNIKRAWTTLVNPIRQCEPVEG